MILKSALGNFTFPDDVQLNHAKLIRDTVCGQWFSPKPHEEKLYDEDDCYTVVGNHNSQLINMIDFTLEILVPKPTKKPKRLQRDAIEAMTIFDEVVL